MHTIPFALMWELFARGRWILPGALLGANLLPAFLLFSLQREGGIVPTDPAMLVMNLVLMQINMFAFAAAIMMAQGHPKRLYAFPVPTATIVTWHLLPAMVLMAFEVAASTAALNALFHLDWPVWGPAILMAVAFAAVQATVWLTEKSFWLPWGLAGVAGALGLWYKSRHGSMFSQPEHLWQQVTPVDGVTMAGVATLAFVVAVIGVARNRRGEPLGAQGILTWLEQGFDLRFPAVQAFRSPLAAQAWYEWRQKGWAMPATVVFGMLTGVTAWAIFSRDLQDLWKGCIGGGVMLSVVGLIGGMILGNTGVNDSNLAIGHFLGTRPITTPALARIILKMSAASVLSAWAIWAASLLGLYFLLCAIPDLPRPDLPKDIKWWYFPATLLGSWITAGVGASIVLGGRIRLFIGLIVGAISLLMGELLFAKLFVQNEAQARLLFFTTIGGISAMVILVAALSFAVAWHRGMISSQTLCLSAASWAFVCGLLLLTGWIDTHEQTLYGTLASSLLLIGFLALPLWPLAAAPLALAWNRHR